uniref:Transposase Tc1-like domain-containing protein n=1 Tax=Astyanax mexicanus TaxID=7994 RepID=A0A8B9JPA9_ASTMX
MKHKWEEAGANVCDRTVRNRLKEMGFQYRKAKRKPSLTPKHKRTRLQWSLMIWGCMSGKGTGEMTVVNSSINAQVYIDILDSFLIPSIEQMFGDNEIIFQDDNASCHRAKTVKAFLGERHIQSMSWPANSPDLNPIENLSCHDVCRCSPPNKNASNYEALHVENGVEQWFILCCV